MSIPAAQRRVVLEDQGRDPQVVRGDGGALAAELRIHPRVVVSGLVVGEEHLDSVLHQEPAEQLLVVGRLAAEGEAGSKLGEDDIRNQDRVCQLEELGDGFVP